MPELVCKKWIPNGKKFFVVGLAAITTGGRGRVFLHSAKSPLHSAKALPSVALGKVRSAKIFLAKGLCRVLFIRTLGKIIFFYRVLGAALGKIFSAVAAPAVNGYFAECPTQHSAKFFFKKISLPSAPAQALGNFF